MMNAPTINGAPFLLSAEPDGIQFFTAANGEPIPTEKITYTEAINRLDSGLYDDVNNMVAGFCVVYTITEGERQGYFVATPSELCELYRWLVATLFADEQLTKNRTVKVIDNDGAMGLAPVFIGKGGELPMIMSGLRLALSNHVENIAYQRYGAGGAVHAAQLYLAMMDGCEEGRIILNQDARKTLTDYCEYLCSRMAAGETPCEPKYH
ncbi:hypothetical protein NMD75_04510 [Edwardsiella tarda]